MNIYIKRFLRKIRIFKLRFVHCDDCRNIKHMSYNDYIIKEIAEKETGITQIYFCKKCRKIRKENDD